jgi:hypothetical protein
MSYVERLQRNANELQIWETCQDRLWQLSSHLTFGEHMGAMESLG